MCREIYIFGECPGLSRESSPIILRAHDLEARELDGCTAFFNADVLVEDNPTGQIITLTPAETSEGADVFVLHFPHPYVSAGPSTMLFCRLRSPKDHGPMHGPRSPVAHCVLTARRGGILYVRAGYPDLQRRLTLRYLGDGLWALKGEEEKVLGFREIAELMLNL